MTALEPIPAVSRLSPRCVRILGGNPGKFTLQGTNTYLLGTGRSRILVDTAEGRPAWLAELRASLAAEKAVVATALLTHRHRDHVCGVRDLLRACPDAAVYKFPPTELEDGDAAAALEPTVVRPLRDGDRFAVEGATLTARHMPGHTKDHVVFALDEEDAMFTGDAVLGQGTAKFEDLGTYLASLKSMRGLFKGRAYPGHGPVIENGPARIDAYIEHRRQREAQVVQTLESRREEGEGRFVAWTAMEITKVVYKDTPANLLEAACEGVVQILEKLLAEGGVEREESGGDIRWRRV
jgi:ribonuclease/clavin/mitogillin